MKGRKLTLEEVLRLDDGSNVWVEDVQELKYGELHKYNKGFKTLVDFHNKFYMLSDFIEEDGLDFYEWIEELDEVVIISKKDLLNFFLNENELQIGDDYYRNSFEADFKEKVDKLYKEHSVIKKLED